MNRRWIKANLTHTLTYIQKHIFYRYMQKQLFYQFSKFKFSFCTERRRYIFWSIVYKICSTIFWYQKYFHIFSRNIKSFQWSEHFFWSWRNIENCIFVFNLRLPFSIHFIKSSQDIKHFFSQYKMKKEFCASKKGRKVKKELKIKIATVKCDQWTGRNDVTLFSIMSYLLNIPKCFIVKGKKTKKWIRVELIGENLDIKSQSEVKKKRRHKKELSFNDMKLEWT